MLVFKEFENNEFSILDTEDNVIESISGEELLNILCTTDLEIKGLSLNNKGFVVDDSKTVLYKPVKAKNSNLIKAKKEKNDEFYTQLPDIEKELSHYPVETFKDKVIYCPCDSVDMSNGYISNFAIYFYNNFKVLGIKKLICTCYSDGINYFEYDGKTELKESRGSGDFRSEYCTKLLQEADIVVTNPPFSLFREFLAWVVPSNKKFITLADQNCITYKEVFPLLKNNKMWVGTQTGITSMMFEVPDSYPVPDYAVEWCKKHTTKDYFDNHRLTYLRGISWFTNVDINKRHDKLIGLSMQDLIDKGVEFPKYDNYDAIDVSKVKEIPMDYDGVMGVPITFLYQYCPEQFEIIDINPHFFSLVEQGLPKLKQLTLHNANKKDPYARILIRHRKDENGKLI